MALKTKYAPKDNSLAPSPFWTNCPWDEMNDDPSIGWKQEIDFAQFRLGTGGALAHWLDGIDLVAVGSGTLTDGDEVGGAVILTEAGDNTGIAFATTTKPFQISTAHGSLWWEMRIKSSSLANTSHGWFAGLIDAATISATVPIAAAGTLADENFVGFHRLESDGDAIDTVYKADGVTQVTLQADAIVPVVNVYNKIGMFYNMHTQTLTFYNNGTALTSTVLPSVIGSTAGTAYPNDVRMGLVFAYLCDTTNAGTVTLSGKMRCAQLNVT